MSFHAALAKAAHYRATMQIEPILEIPFGIDAQELLVRNLKIGHNDAAVGIADALVDSLDPKGEIIRSYSLDPVMTLCSDPEIERSARRALAVIPEYFVVEGKHANMLRNAIAAELTYLWLKACEPVYTLLSPAPTSAVTHDA